MTQTIHIQGMMCPHCEARVKGVLEALEGVSAAAVSHEAGTTQFNNDPGRVPEVSNLLVKDQDGFIWGKTRELAKYYFYTMAHTNLINGLSEEVAVADFTPWWKPAMTGLNVALGVLTAGAALMYVLSEVKSRKEGK